jgi:hypothetical protein
MILHGGDIVIHTRIQEREHDFFLDEGEPINLIFCLLTFYIVIKCLRHLILDDFIDHSSEILLNCFASAVRP